MNTTLRTVVDTREAPAIVGLMQAASQTATVEIDASLLNALRARRPGKDDRSLLEELARVELGWRRWLTPSSTTR